jgi:hypothetical protein
MMPQIFLPILMIWSRTTFAASSSGIGPLVELSTQLPLPGVGVTPGMVMPPSMLRSTGLPSSTRTSFTLELVIVK